MKRFFILFLVLALLLTACAAPTPGATVEPGKTTDEPAQSAVTETPAPTDVVAVTATATDAADAGVGVFAVPVRTADTLSFKCAPSEIIFGVKSLDPTITKVLFFYRVVDKSSSAAARAMVDSKEMVSGEGGNFTLLFKAVSVKENLRFTNGWFEYQFVGMNKKNEIVGRSDKIVKQVTFTLGCP